MATLHVRNVPDPVYDLLRRRAEANGRSISAEAVSLIQQGLTARPWSPSQASWLGRRRRPTGTGLFTTFTERARRTVVAAQDEARELGHDHVGTGHILLGLLHGGEDWPAKRALDTLGLTLDDARARLLELVPRGEEQPTGRIRFEPGAKKALELALRESLTLGHTHIGTEHVLLGVVGEGEGAGAQIVASVEPDADAVRSCVLTGAADVAAAAALQAPAYLVVDLEGDAADWETQLNDAAARGYEVVEILDRRAIFRRA